MDKKTLNVVTLADLTPDPANARKHSPRNVGTIVSALQEVGAARSIVIDENGVILAGNATADAAAEAGITKVQVIEADGQTLIAVRRRGLTPEQKARLALFDNRSAELADGWDVDVLQQMIADSVSLDGLWNEDELAEMIGSDPKAGMTDPDDVPAERATSIKAGDLFELGRHRLLCGDSTKAEDVARLMGGLKANTTHADPPYGMGKEKDGIVNDNLYRDKLDQFQMNWWSAQRLHLVDNASAYIWGNAEDLWRLWYKGGLQDSERLTFRNEIVWAKGDAGAGGISHQGAEGLRQYPKETERALFFMLGEQGFNNNADNYWEGWDGVRLYLKAEADKVGLTPAKLKEVCGVGMYSHWFTESQWAFITEEHYLKLQREYDGFKREYDELKREFYATRAYFDNTHENMTDVWECGRVTGLERYDHATPKPMELVSRAIKSSTPESGLVYVPFGGTSPEVIACEQTNRKCRAIEIQPRYCQVIIDRWEAFTGQKATKL